MKLTCISIGCIFLACIAAAQSPATSIQATDTTIRLHLPVVPPDIDYTPFREVKVLDNRYDITAPDVLADEKTTPLYTFGEPLASAVGTHLTGTITALRKGDKSLLLDFHEFRILRASLQVWVDVYSKTTGNAYRKIASIHYSYLISGEINEDISWVLGRVLAAAGTPGGSPLPSIHDKKRRRAYRRLEKAYIAYVKDAVETSIEQIDRPLRKKWEDSPILLQKPSSDGVYSDLAQFRDNTLRRDTLTMELDPKDSVYHLRGNMRSLRSYHHRYPIAAAFRGDLYINLFPFSLHQNQYLRLEAENGIFYFSIPSSLPNFPTLMELHSVNYHSGSPAGSGNLLVDLAGIFVHAAIMSAIEAAEKKRILKQGLQDKYRTCFVDMESGDILCRK